MARLCSSLNKSTEAKSCLYKDLHSQDGAKRKSTQNRCMSLKNGPLPAENDHPGPHRGR